MDMRRAVAWLVCIALAIPVTFILYWLVDIPFIEAGVFSLIGVVLMAALFAILADTFLKLGLLDERGWHLGVVDPMGPIAGGEDEEELPDGHTPIVSREQRLKQQGRRA